MKQDIKEILFLLFQLSIAMGIFLIGGEDRLAVLGGEDILAVAITVIAIGGYQGYIYEKKTDEKRKDFVK